MFDNNFFGGYESDMLFIQADYWEEIQEILKEEMEEDD